MRPQQVRWMIAAFAIVAPLSTSPLRAGYIETFSSPPSTAGWIAQGGSQSNPGSGGNPGGYLQSSNAIAAFPWIAPGAGASGGNFEGDIWTKEGDSITFGFDINVLSADTMVGSPRVFFYANGAYPNYWIYAWENANLDQADGWVHLSVPLDKNWDDATYLANGWAKNGSPGSLVSVLSNLGAEWDINPVGGTFVTGATNTIGIDNIGWTVVPEPASWVLAAVGTLAGLAMARRRARRKV